jgi:hypothetical protein
MAPQPGSLALTHAMSVQHSSTGQQAPIAAPAAAAAVPQNGSMLVRHHP